MFPFAQELNIPVGVTNIILTCNLAECVWNISNEGNNITTDSYTISEISYKQSTNISLMRVTIIGVATGLLGVASNPNGTPATTILGLLATPIWGC